MTIVDNNVLSALAKIDRLEMLPALFSTVGTPLSVIDELDRAEATGYEFVSQINRVKSHEGGWLEIISPAQTEIALAEEIADHALSSADARCLAIAANRDRRLITDDAHVGTIGQQRSIEVWDLVLLLRVAIQTDVISTSEELSTIISRLSERDGYQFSKDAERALFDTFANS